ncbi:MAG: hypothetical protein QHJ82_05110 [Verrucomicrobiota bacterium]|nr:hypothetical protein [Verrucomicrobiota bacterium]
MHLSGSGGGKQEYHDPDGWYQVINWQAEANLDIKPQPFVRQGDYLVSDRADVTGSIRFHGCAEDYFFGSTTIWRFDATEQYDLKSHEVYTMICVDDCAVDYVGMPLGSAINPDAPDIYGLKYDGITGVLTNLVDLPSIWFFENRYPIPARACLTGSGTNLLDSLTGSTRPSESDQPILPGRKCAIEITLTNSGAAAVHGQVKLDIYLSEDSALEHGIDVLVHEIPMSDINLLPGADFSLSATATLPPPAYFGRNKAGQWSFLCEVNMLNGGPGLVCRNRKVLVGEKIWLGQALQVLTHGFGNNLLGPSFLEPWHELKSKYARVTVNHPVHRGVDTYVSNWPSSEGWPEAIGLFLLGVYLQVIDQAPLAHLAFSASKLHMALARAHAVGAACQIASDMEQIWSLDPRLTQSGYQVVHIIGHSRGAAVNALVTRLLTQHGHRVNQYTALDGYSTDWPHGSGILGDIGIVEELVAAQSQQLLDRAVNYRVEDGLAVVIFDMLNPLLAIDFQRRFTGPFEGFSEAVRQSIRSVLPDWRAPVRAGMENLLIHGTGTGTSKRSNHLNIVALYSGESSDVLSTYSLDSYLGRVLAEPIIALSLAPAQPNPGPPEIGKDETTDQIGADFADGSFEAIGEIADGARALAFPAAPDDAIKVLLAQLQNTTAMFATAWGASGNVRLAKTDHTYVAEFRGAHSPSIGQFVALLPGAESIQVELFVSGATPYSALDVLFKSNVVGRLQLSNTVTPAPARVPLQGAFGSGEIRLVVTGGTDNTVVQLDNLHIVYKRPIIERASIEPDGSLRLVIAGAQESAFAVEASRDTKEWSVLGFASQDTSSAEYVHKRSSNIPWLFYRVRLVR